LHHGGASVRLLLNREFSVASGTGKEDVVPGQRRGMYAGLPVQPGIPIVVSPAQRAGMPRFSV
jgi:hypothetical protein